MAKPPTPMRQLDPFFSRSNGLIQVAMLGGAVTQGVM